MAKEGDEVLKEFVRRVNALLDRLQKAAGVGEGPMNQADLECPRRCFSRAPNKHLSQHARTNARRQASGIHGDPGGRRCQKARAD